MTGAWAGARLLLLAGDLPPLAAGDVTAAATSEGRTAELEGRCFVAAGGARLLVLAVRAGEARPGAAPSLELRSDGGKRALQPDTMVDLAALAREHLAGLDPESRAQLGELILSLARPHLDGPGAFTLAKDLHLLRDALREPLARVEVARDEPQAVVVDKLLALDQRAFWVEGWTRDEDATFDRLTAISPEGQEVALAHPFRHRRPDIEEQLGAFGPGPRHGFAAFFELPYPSRLEQGWVVQWRDAGGRGVETAAPAADPGANAAQDYLLERFTSDQPDREELRHGHLRPALAALQDRHRRSIEVESVTDYGAPPASPGVSIVVTLYGRIDFVHHQVLHFSQDPALHGAELIYVLDDPPLGKALETLAAQVHALHGLPFRVARLSRNAGFPVANILGATLARGRLLLLLNADVLPDRPGWLEQMVGFYDSQPDIGALGPKLLFEDDSIQHAGVYFEREAESRLWGNLHYYKGLHRDFPAAGVTRPVPAITGACLMVDRALYEEVGGLRHEYILQGGYEDSDLCLRLIERGRRNWYLADAELYHLEGQAHAPATRSTTVAHNTWLQTQLWDSLIERVMSEESESAVAKAST